MVEAAIDAKGCSGNSYSRANNEPRRDVAPDWRPVDGISIPHDRVDELVEAGETSPHHVETSARIPGFQVPWKRDGTHKKAQEGEGGEDVVGGSHLRVFKRWQMSTLSGTAAR